MPPRRPSPSHHLCQVVDFSAALTAREVMFWRICFQHLLATCKTADDCTLLFRR